MRRIFHVRQDNLPLPVILLEDCDVDLGRALRPAFNALWQAGGRHGSPNYGDQGTWKPSWSANPSQNRPGEDYRRGKL